MMKRSSYDGDQEEDRRFTRRRFDRDSDGSDRERHRLHRSESFSAFRRDFPKRFRSERRDRFSSPSLRRSNSEKEPFLSSSSASASASASAADLGKISESAAERWRGEGSYGHRHPRHRYEDLGRGNRRSADSSGGESKAEKAAGESCSSSEMEEGELEPDPDPDPEENRRKGEADGGENVQIVRSEEILSTGNGNDEVKKLNDLEMVEEEGGKMEIVDNGEDGVGEGEKKEIPEPEGKGDASVVEEETIEKKLEDVEATGDMEADREKEEEGDADAERMEGGYINLEAEPEHIVENVRKEEADPKVVLEEPQDKSKDKGKSVANEDSADDDREDAMEGPSNTRGFNLFFPSAAAKANPGEISAGKLKDEKLKLEPLDLSLGLPGVPQDMKPASPSRGRSVQSMPSSFRTNSDGFTTSISFSGSQTFLHNPSCSLTQNSVDYEQSVGSHPIFHAVDQGSNGTIWQAQTSNEPNWKGGAGPLFQRVLANGNPLHGKPNGLSRQSSLPRQLSPTRNHGSRGDTRSRHGKDKRLLTRERSSSSLFRSEQQEGEQLVLNAVGFERIISKIVSEPMQVVGRVFQEMTDHSVSYLKEAVCEIVVNVDKRGKLHALQEVLQRRSDFTVEAMSKCPRTLLEILVALKTGLPDTLLRSHNNVPSSDLAEVFLNVKCRNLTCRNILPVDDCECKVCTQKSGFCSACMCLVCSKFDNASNTCAWVGCDVCLHWCHTDCGLRDAHIRSGPCSKTQGMTEMQFNCVACNHASEMYGFVKDVFMTFAKGWKAETLANELQYVRRIFAASNDVKGRKLCDMANQMLLKVEDKANLSEVVNYTIGFFSESGANMSNPSITPPKEPSRNIAEGSNGATCPSKEATWLPSLFSDKVSHRENAGVLSILDRNRLGRQTMDAELQPRPEQKVVVDELESVVRFKQAEAKMYQERADSARREAEGLKRIAVAKNVQTEEDYASKIARLRLSEAEERRRQKLEELQVIERAHREYFNMKMRMESDINDLLLKMEAAKRNFST